MRRIGLLLIVLTLGLASAAWAEKSAAEILQVMDDQANQFADMKSKMVFAVKSADGPEKTTSLVAYQKGPKRMYQFIETGMAFLALNADESYVYMPDDKKVRRIAAHSRNQSFMGSDYNAADMSTTRYAEIYEPKMLATTDAEWKLELTPKPGKEAAYAKVAISINREINALSRLDYYNAKGELEKTELRKDYKKIDGQWYCMNIEITNAKTNHKTFIRMSDTNFNCGLSDDLFTQRQLKRLEQ